jgi:ABC-type Na+ efflux pump permease subunit
MDILVLVCKVILAMAAFGILLRLGVAAILSAFNRRLRPPLSAGELAFLGFLGVLLICTGIVALDFAIYWVLQLKPLIM